MVDRKIARLRIISSSLELWRKDQDITLSDLVEASLSLMRRSEFKDGYAKAEEDQKREKLRQEAIERNGGTEPEYHTCHFCGEYVANGYTVNGKRHWLSDCRPDLVKHEPGETCTWWHSAILAEDHEGRNCYAFQKRKDLPYENWEWTDEHEHFDEDGPM